MNQQKTLVTGQRSSSTHRTAASVRWLQGVLLTSALLALSVPGGAARAEDDCAQPPVPSLPDGASASIEQMLAGRDAVQNFQSENMLYMQCLEARFTAARARVDSSDRAIQATARAEYSAAYEAYNAAVSAEEEIAGSFNIELREYRAANR